MGIILDEEKYAERLLEKGFKDDLKWSDIFILAKYFRYKGYKPAKIKKSIGEFYEKHCYFGNKNIINSRIESAIKKSEKQPLYIPMDVYITKEEIKKIRSIHYYRYEKIVFVMLVIARRNKMLYNSHSSRYYVNEKFSDILKIAKVYCGKDERNKIKHDLYTLGMIVTPEMNKMSEYNRGDIQELLYAYDSKNYAVIVNNFDDILMFYPQLCDDCGKEIPYKKRKKNNLCEECYSSKRIVEKRRRAKEKYHLKTQ